MSEGESVRTNMKSSQQEPLEEACEDQLEGYSFVRTLGKGNFGKVKLGIHVLTGEHVAIKILEKDLIFEKADIERISREIKIMKLIRHPHLIQLYEIIEKPKRLYLIMEYSEGGDLFDLIVQNQKLSESKAVRLYAQILLGLQYLHSKGVTHRDMKPENILISGEDVKIADFGLGNFFKEGQMLKTACGSPCYASPEMLSRLPYNPELVDIWSSGIILYAMVCGYLPFEDESTPKLYQKIKTTNPRYPRSLSEDLKKLLKRVLDKNPQTRIRISQIKKDPWMSKQFCKLQPEEFSVNPIQLQKIVARYGISDEKKLSNYLVKNKHNNLTTIYYLAIKNKEDLDIQEEEDPLRVVQKNESKTTGGELQKELNPIIQKSDIKQTRPDPNQKVELPIEPDRPHQTTQPQSQKQQKQKQPKQSDQKIAGFSEKEAVGLTKVEDRPQLSSNSSHDKTNSLINEISFSQLETFSQQKSQIMRDQPPQSEDLSENPKGFEQNRDGQSYGQDYSQGQRIDNHEQSIDDSPQKQQYVEQKRSSQEEVSKKSHEEEHEEQSLTPPSPIVNSQNGEEKIQQVKQKTASPKRQPKKSIIQKNVNSDQRPKPKINGKYSENNSRLNNNNKGTISRNDERQSDSYSQQRERNKTQTRRRGSEDIVALNKPQLQAKADMKIARHNTSQNEERSSKIHEKPKLIKTRRMEVQNSSSKDKNRKVPPLHERSHSRDKTLSHKKVIGKVVSNQPFLMDPCRLVLCDWAKLSSILTELGAEGRVQYFKYGKQCVYISKSSLRGIKSLNQIIQNINSGDLS